MLRESVGRFVENPRLMVSDTKTGAHLGAKSRRGPPRMGCDLWLPAPKPLYLQANRGPLKNVMFLEKRGCGPQRQTVDTPSPAALRDTPQRGRGAKRPGGESQTERGGQQ
jgi:hypothetical protein